jgi:MoxR-like ATPase
LAVNVALATGRPLLVRGPSGSGKSSLAYNVARVLRRRYYEFVVTSHTQAQDLLWEFDAVRRLGDAQAQRLVVVEVPAAAALGPESELGVAPGPSIVWYSYYPYIEPGLLWWIFEPHTAPQRGHPNPPASFPAARDPVVFIPEREDGGPVLLIDEVDKADPDFANNLLVPFGSLQFTVEEIGYTVVFQQPKDQIDADRVKRRPLIVITTNEERRLPQAFLRRCVALELEGPGPDGLIEIASKIYGAKDSTLYRRIVDAMTGLVRKRLGIDNNDAEELARVHLNVAQFLDAVQACRHLAGVERDTTLFDAMIEMTSWKEEGSI